MGIIKNGEKDTIIYKSFNPRPDTNFVSKEVLWVNYSTGEIFNCKDNTTNKNIWIGQRGNIVGVSTNMNDPFSDNSCTAYYKLDGNANDELGSHNGTVTGSVSYENGKFGQSVKCSSTSNYITLPVSFNSVNCSVSCWFKCTTSDLNSNNNTIIGNKTGGGLRYILGSDSNGKLSFTIGDNSIITIYSNGVYADNIWHHLVGVIKNNKPIFYIDNVNINPTNSTADNSGNDDLYIAHRSGYSNNYKGLVDHVRVFNRALTEDEINMLYNEVL